MHSNSPTSTFVFSLGITSLTCKKKRENTNINHNPPRRDRRQTTTPLGIDSKHAGDSLRSRSHVRERHGPGRHTVRGSREQDQRWVVQGRDGPDRAGSIPCHRRCVTFAHLQVPSEVPSCSTWPHSWTFHSSPIKLI